METVELNQGFLQSLAYDDTTRELHVHFKDGDYTIYYEVPKIDYLGFVASGNYTDFYTERIEPRFPSKKINWFLKPGDLITWLFYDIASKEYKKVLIL